METQVQAPMASEHAGIQQRVADAITAFCGRMLFVYIHIVLFAAWIITNGFGHDFFPFNFLTMAVSLEAIFLSTFVLISQNRQQAIAETHNQAVQSRLLQMINDVMTDEKLDLKNEELISVLLNRIDVEHISPLLARVDAVAQCVNRIEATIQGNAGKQTNPTP